MRIESNASGAIPDVHLIQLDNTAPIAFVDITTPGGNCGKFPVNTVLGGTFVATDRNFGSFSLGTAPSSPPIPINPLSPGFFETPPGGSPWSLNTGGMPSCGYVIEVEVADRSIVNSVSGGHNRAFASTGFCLL